MTLLRAAALLPCLFVPGWLAVSLFRAEGDTLKSGERLFLACALGAGIASLWALVLALASAYSLTALLIALGATSAASALAARRRVLWLKETGLKETALALAVVGIALVLFAPPWSIVFGWSDVGVYANISAHVEAEGGLAVHNEVASRVDEGRRELLYHGETKRAAPEVYFENQFFIIDDFESGTTRPWFYFLWPSLMAVFASFLGVGAQYWAITAVSALALWGFLLLARRLLGGSWAIAAALLFALSPLMRYFSHYTISEMMNLFLFLAGSICLLAYLRPGEAGGGGGVAVLAAVFYSLGFLCRIDFIFILLPVFICYAARGLRGSADAADLRFLAALAAGAAAAALAGFAYSSVYFRSIWRSYFGSFGPAHWAVAAAVALGGAAALLLGRRLGGYARRVAQARALWVPALWLILCGAFVFLYFIRPRGADAVIGYGFIKQMKGPSYMREGLVRWGWYLSFAGLAAMFAGYAAWFTRRRGFGEYALGLIGLSYTLLYAWNMRAMPMHIQVMRRLLPVVFPLGVMALVGGLEYLVGSCGRLRLARHAARARAACGILALGLLLYLGAFALNASLPIIGLDEGGNQAEVVARIAEDIGNGTAVMDYHLGDLLGPPLRCMHGVESAWLKDNSLLGQESFLSLLGDLERGEEGLFLLWRPRTSGEPLHLIEPLRAVRVRAYRLHEESLEKSFEHRPSGRSALEEEFVLYRLLRARGGGASAAPAGAG